MFSSHQIVEGNKEKSEIKKFHNIIEIITSFKLRSIENHDRLGIITQRRATI